MNEAMSGSGRLELWGGLECTIARIGDAYRDETAETGHASRQSDLDAIRRFADIRKRRSRLAAGAALPRHLELVQ